MALLISKELSIIGGIKTNQIYIRLFLNLDYSGTNLYVNTETYISKEAYLDGKKNIIKINEIPDSKIFKYDRKEDGVDLLLIAHNKLKNLLSTDEITNVPELDPSTGEFLVNQHKEVIMNKIIYNLKFADKNQIKIIDIK